VALPALVNLILPEYRQAVDPMRLLLVGLVGFAFGIPATQYLITVNRQWLQVAITGAFLVGMARSEWPALTWRRVLLAICRC
jgi:O-antigen/teichoic acid export membrane protein